MKFKVGDRVKVRKDLVDGQEYDGQSFIGDMNKFIGEIVTIESVYDDHYHIKEEDDDYNGCLWHWNWTDEMFEPNAIIFAKTDLKDGMVIECRNGKRGMVLGDEVLDMGDYTEINHFNDTLEHRFKNNTFTIDKVYKSHSHNLYGYFRDCYLELIWERPKMKMTIEEIEKRLGYKIEIVTKD